MKKIFRQPALRLYRYIRRKIASPPPQQLGVTPMDTEKIALFKQYDHLAAQKGFDGLYVLLSFDCDTPDDIPAADHLHNWFQARGLKAAYCVPGVMLQQGAEVYRRIAASGAEFLNHGGAPHAEWRDGRYWATTFYHEMTPEQVKADIRLGDRIIRETLGCQPEGFRAPHFGGFQQEHQKAIIYETLRELGYHFSSSTTPEQAYVQGPIIPVAENLYEIPLSGSWAAPNILLDSWSYVKSPYQPEIKPDYARIFLQTVEELLSHGVKGLLNYYVDPAHVYRSDDFYHIFEQLITFNVRMLDYKTLLAMTKGTHVANIET